MFKNVSRKITFKLKYLRPWSKLTKVLKGTLIGYYSKKLNPEFARFSLILQNGANVPKDSRKWRKIVRKSWKSDLGVWSYKLVHMTASWCCRNFAPFAIFSWIQVFPYYLRARNTSFLRKYREWCKISKISRIPFFLTVDAVMCTNL